MGKIGIYMGSAVLYGIILVSSVLMAWIAETRQKNKIYLVILIIVLSFFLSFRGESVGTDTRTYLSMATSIKNGMFNRIYGDIGFKYFIAIVVKLIPLQNGIIIVCSILTVCFFILRLWEIKDSINFTIGVFIFVSYFYISCFNYTRQGLAMGLAFWATRYLFSKRFMRYLFVISLCSLLHASAICMIIPVFIYILVSDKGKIAVKDFFLCLVVFAIGVLYIIYSNRATYLLDKYIVSSNLTGGRVGSFFTIFFVIVIEIVSNITKNRNTDSSYLVDDNDVNDHIDIGIRNTSKYVYMFGVLISILLQRFEFASRVALYYLTFEMIYYGDEFDNGIVKVLKRLGIVILLIRSFYLVLATGGYGIMPYSLFLY